jgi:NAD(P)H-hydrate epimerase
MTDFDPSVLKDLYIPASSSHKSQNGKVMLIAGSKLFHAASIWPLTVMSRIVDMVFYASVAENNELVAKMKEKFLNGIIIPRERIDDYIKEADCVLIGPGMPRESGIESGDDDTKVLTESLLSKYNNKKWVVDGGSLQTIDPEVLKNLKVMPILTPHQREFEVIKVKSQNAKVKNVIKNSKVEEQVEIFAREYNCEVLLKGEKDIVCSPSQSMQISGGNPGMTKGGTGDVLAGLVASFYAKNDAFLSATAASYINKKAGESLYQKVGLYFNGSDLADEIPKVMKELLNY